MQLQRRRRHHRGHRPLHRRGDRLALGGAGGDQHHPAGLEDRAHALGDPTARNPAHIAAEIRGGVGARRRRQRHRARPRRQRRRRLVEPDMAVAADAEQLQVDPARVRDPPLVGLPRRGQILRRGLRRAQSARGRVHTVEQPAPHHAAERPRIVGTEAHILVEQEHLRPREADPPAAAAVDELAVDRQRGAARGHTDDTAPAAAQHTPEEPGRDQRSLLCRGNHHDLHRRLPSPRRAHRPRPPERRARSVAASNKCGPGPLTANTIVSPTQVRRGCDRPSAAALAAPAGGWRCGCLCVPSWSRLAATLQSCPPPAPTPTDVCLANEIRLVKPCSGEPPKRARPRRALRSAGPPQRSSPSCPAAAATPAGGAGPSRRRRRSDHDRSSRGPGRRRQRGRCRRSSPDPGAPCGARR